MSYNCLTLVIFWCARFVKPRITSFPANCYPLMSSLHVIGRRILLKAKCIILLFVILLLKFLRQNVRRQDTLCGHLCITGCGSSIIVLSPNTDHYLASPRNTGTMVLLPVAGNKPHRIPQRFQRIHLTQALLPA